MVISGDFISGRSGKLMVTQFGHTQSKNNVLFLPSIFEEMNLSRAVVAKQAQMLSHSGWTVYCLDYYGTGDSQGEIEHVHPHMWLDDIYDAARWIASRGAQDLRIWAMRLGGLLALQSIEQLNEILPLQGIVLWKPVPKGKQFMTQFLRLKQANSMMQGEQKVNWREHILAGQPTEVAGYEVNAALLGGLDEMVFPDSVQHHLPQSCTIHWLELASKSVTPAITKAISQWPAERIYVSAFDGSAFWQIPEIFEQNFLHQPTRNALQGRVA